MLGYYWMMHFILEFELKLEKKENKIEKEKKRKGKKKMKAIHVADQSKNKKHTLAHNVCQPMSLL
jgi:ribosomal protein L32